MKGRLFFLVLALALSAAPAFARSACYSPQQLRAEQLLRLHSELLVITLTCRQDSYGRALSDEYVAFTHKNIGILHDAEGAMTAYYKASQKGDPVGHLDHLRTRLGNEFGQKAGRMTAPAFCQAYRDKVAQFEALSSQGLESHVRNMMVLDKSYVQPCGKAAAKGKLR